MTKKPCEVPMPPKLWINRRFVGETSKEKVGLSMQEGLLMPDLDEVLLAIKFDYIICRGTA